MYIDDIIVTGKTDEEHHRNLNEVLNRLEKAGMRLKEVKCKYMVPEIEYLSHKINQEGLQPSDSKVAAIVEAPPPKNVSELKSFLGMVNYYGKFLPNLSTTLASLYQLLRKETPWRWSDEEQQAFDKVKTFLQSSNLLVHFDGDKPIVLACDASPYGVGAVLSHRMEDGTDRPIAFASRTLAPVEKRYSHLDKEALAIIFGVKHFHQYIYGRPFVLLSDHKPLMHILSESRDGHSCWERTITGSNTEQGPSKLMLMPSADCHVTHNLPGCLRHQKPCTLWSTCSISLPD